MVAGRRGLSAPPGPGWRKLHPSLWRVLRRASAGVYGRPPAAGRTMQAVAVNIDGGDAFAGALWRTFNGWNMSNDAAAGRTIRAVIPPASEAGQKVAAALTACNGAIKANDPEVVAAGTKHAGSATPFFEPFRVRVRGGGTHSATATCDVGGWLIRTAKYRAAKSIVCDAIELLRLRATDGIDVLDGDLLRELVAAKAVVSSVPAGVFVNTPDHYRRALDAAAQIAAGSTKEWRDPRSRAAAADEVARCARHMVYFRA